MSSRIIVKNLPDYATQDSIRKHFGSQKDLHDSLTDVKLAQFPSGRSRRFCFIGYKSQDDAQRAVEYFNRSFIDTTRISVELATRVTQDLLDQKQLDRKKGRKSNTNSNEDKPSGDVKDKDTANLEDYSLSADNVDDNGPAVLEQLADTANSEEASWLRKHIVRQKPKEAESKPKEAENLSIIEMNKRKIAETGRLFIRNLTFSVDEKFLKETFSKFGKLVEVHLPLDAATNASKGIAFVQFENAEAAKTAYESLDGSSFQGRIVHILPGNQRNSLENLSEFELSKLPLKKQRHIKKKLQASKNDNEWNPLFVTADNAVSSIASQIGMEKSDLIDPTSSESAVKQALAETQIIQEIKSFLEHQGVNVSFLTTKSQKENDKSAKYSDTVLIAKNFNHAVSDSELREMFEACGKVERMILPPQGLVAIIEYSNVVDARRAFATLAYRRIGNSILYLQKAPENIFVESSDLIDPESKKEEEPNSKASATKPVADPTADSESSTVFVKNISFTTTQDGLRRLFDSQPGFLKATLRVRADPKRPGQFLSMGFGFIDFDSREHAINTINGLDGFSLDGHKLQLQLARSYGADADDSNELTKKRKFGVQQVTKILIKNLPFEATKRDIRALFETYGQVKSVRVPQKMDRTNQGFGFVEFATPQEAQNAMDALKHTHLLGRHLVLQFAKLGAGADDEEHSIAKSKKYEKLNESLKSSKKLKESEIDFEDYRDSDDDNEEL